jgi:hypothetical protein
MNIFNFTKSFPDEEACILHFKAQEHVCKLRDVMGKRDDGHKLVPVAVAYPTDFRSKIDHIKIID